MYLKVIKEGLCYLSASCKIGTERPVTPEVAGSSPVRSAINSLFLWEFLEKHLPLVRHQIPVSP